MKLGEYIGASFSYKVSSTNNAEELPNGVFRSLTSLYGNGYLNIKPLEVTSRYTDNGKGESIYNIDMVFDLPNEN